MVDTVKKNKKVLVHCQSEEQASRLFSAVMRSGGRVNGKEVEFDVRDVESVDLVIEEIQKKAFSINIRAAIMAEPPPPCVACHHSECYRRRGAEQEK